MNWEIVIGLETHAQLSTVSKMFSGGSTAFGALPNTQANAVDIALPGVLPVANREAVAKAIRFGLAVNGGDPKNINRRSIFARKNYFYPDLPKGYQISQYELPIVQGGKIAITSPSRGEIEVRLTRAHLEEDAGKSFHGEAISGVADYAVADLAVPDNPLVNEERDLTKLSAIDLNRAGIPLLEIVSEPDMRSAEEAVAYAKALHALVRWIDICDGNMQEGSFRCDANVSVRRPGAPLGTRAEIKNLNSFRFLERAIEFEAKRQIEILEDGGKIVQETRLYDPDKDETRSMRTKEDAHDYRYFPDPDLLPLEVSEEWINQERAKLPELPQAKRERYRRDYSLSAYDAATLTQSREMAEYFEKAVLELGNIQVAKVTMALVGGPEKLVANWVTGELAAALNRDNLEIAQSPVKPEQLVELLSKIVDGTINTKQAKEIVFREIWEVGKHVSRDATVTPKGVAVTVKAGMVDVIIDAKGLKQISDAAAIEKIVDDVLAANAKQVEDYRAGKEKAFNSLVGQVMKTTQGKANPARVNEILKRKLAG